MSDPLCTDLHDLTLFQKDGKERDMTDLAFLPIRNPKLNKLYEKLRDLFWTVSHIDFSNDRSSWSQLDINKKTYTEFLIFLFAQLDGIVNENLSENFQREVAVHSKEAGHFYAMQGANEVIHSETYSFLVETYIENQTRKEQGLNSVKNFPAIRKIAEWCYSYMNPKTHTLLERLIAFCCIEGVIFSSAFAGIYFLKRLNVLPGLCKANEWIARDEGIHTEFGIALFHHFTMIWRTFSAPEESVVHEIIRSAFAVTEEFTREAMQCHLVGLPVEDMISYVQCTCDGISTALGYSKIFNVENRLTWMYQIKLPNKSNFFETKVSEYSLGGDDEDFNFDEKRPH